MSADTVGIIAAALGALAVVLEHIRHRRLDDGTVDRVAELVTQVAVLTEKLDALRERVSSLEDAPGPDK